MRKIKLATTSTADLSPEYCKDNDIILLSNIVIMHDEVIDDDYTADIKAYYNELRGGLLPTTSKNTAEFYYSKLVDTAREYDIILVDISTGLTESTVEAQKAFERLSEEFPEGKFYVVDSMNASCGQGFVLDMAVDELKKGRTVDEIYAYLEENKMSVNSWFTTADLSHLYRGGRISKFSSIVAGSFSINPIMYVTKEGKLAPNTKAIGKKKAFAKLLEIMKEHAFDGEEYSGKVFISHGDNEEDALALKAKVLEKFPKVSGVYINYIHMNLGVHTGPEMIAIFYRGTRV